MIEGALVKFKYLLSNPKEVDDFVFEANFHSLHATHL